MIKNMLDFSRPLRLDLTHGDLNGLVSKSLIIVEPQAKEKNVLLEVDLSENLPKIEFDPFRMEQVLINIVVNALQASPGGEKVFIRTYREGSGGLSRSCGSWPRSVGGGQEEDFRTVLHHQERGDWPRASHCLENSQYPWWGAGGSGGGRKGGDFQNNLATGAVVKTDRRPRRLRGT
jgi:hypothetical protein